MKSLALCVCAFALAWTAFGGADSTKTAGPVRPVRVLEAKKRKAPPIDVRALATSLASAEAAAGPVAPAGATRKSVLPAIMVSAAIAACSTLGVLALIVRLRGTRYGRFRLRMPARPAAAPRRDAQGFAPPEPEDTDAPDGDRATEENSGADDDGFYGVGKEMRSAREEFALAMRLHSGPMGDGLRRGARSACSAESTAAERVKMARKLGIGRGEIDLALRLQKLETIGPEEEVKA